MWLYFEVRYRYKISHMPQVSCHVVNSIAITSIQFVRQQNEFSIEVELRWKNSFVKWAPVVQTWEAYTIKNLFGILSPWIVFIPEIEGILPRGSSLPCVSMAGRALLAGYHRILIQAWYTVVLQAKQLVVYFEWFFKTISDQQIKLHGCISYWY